MKITFLGTGTSTGVPMVGCPCEVCASMDFRDKRLRVSVHLEIEGFSLVIDTTPDFRVQMLTYHIKKLDAILFTHEHRDHVAGLDDVRPFNFLQKKDMPIYASERVLKSLKHTFEYAFVEDRYPGVPALETHLIENKPFKINEIDVLPISGMHAKMPVFGFRFGDFSYVTDMNYLDETEIEKLRDSKILVLNALQKKPHHSHFNLEQAIELAQHVKAKQTYFTHISHSMGLHQDIENELPDTIHLAYDGLELKI